MSESLLDVPEHQSTLARSQAELLLQDIRVLEAGGDVSLTIEDLAGDEPENNVDALDKVLEKLVQAGHPFANATMLSTPPLESTSRRKLLKSTKLL